VKARGSCRVSNGAGEGEVKAFPVEVAWVSERLLRLIVSVGTLEEAALQRDFK